MIEVQHLTKKYGPFTAVDDISFKVERGEILGFLGPNGAGKTTTMRVLTGYMPPTDGKAVVAGFDVQEKPIEAKRRTGYLPETPPLYPDMTVRDYLTFCAKITGVPRAERKARVGATMERAHVSDMADRQCGKLSKGYRQRVGLAQALLHNPEVLILDEPTAGLDPKQRVETRELIKQLAGDHTVILSSHILSEVSQTCQRVVIINKGRVVAVDTPDNLTARLSGAAVLYVQVDAMGADAGAFLAAVPGVTRVSAADGHGAASSSSSAPSGGAASSGNAASFGGLRAFEIESDTGRDVRRELAAAVVTRGWGLLELRPLRASLEDVFLQLLTDDAGPGAAGSGSVDQADPAPQAQAVEPTAQEAAP